MRLSVRHVVALAAVALGAACASARSGGDVEVLRGVDWRLVELRGQPAAPTDIARRPWLRFEVDSARVSGSGGCNRMAGPVHIDGTVLHFGALVSTRMACADNALTRQEVDFQSALGSTDNYEVRSDTLVLRKGSESLARLVR
jgi:heat shock protein HslJ